MKKMKKILAMLLAFAMVLGMTMTTMAAYSPIIINVIGAGSDATFEVLHLIEPDVTQDTGWDFTTNDIAKDYTDAFGLTSGAADPTDAQKQNAIWMLIANQAELNSMTVEIPDSITAATDTQIAAALAAVKASNYELTDNLDTTRATVKVDDAGVYYIEGDETNFVYSPMAAYVSFAYNDQAEPATLSSAGVVAKKQTTDIEKTSDDKVVEIGREVTYTVKSTVPYLPTTDDNRTYQIIDTLTGAQYVGESADDGKVVVNVQVGPQTITDEDGNTEVTSYLFDEEYVLAVTEVTDENIENKYTFTLDLSDELFKDEDGNKVNTYANLEVVVTYQATVVDLIVNNEVKASDGTNDGDEKFGSNAAGLVTGQITLTKYAEDGATTLSNAGFELYKATASTTTDATGATTTTYTEIGNKLTFKEEVEDVKGVYVYDPAGTETTLYTGENGALVVKGLADGTYKFVETDAPAGYSINEEGAGATIVNDETATAVIASTTSIKDTRLLALPSTGGIGTTIFTIAGCAIMIAAAFLFFASRRKENE